MFYLTEFGPTQGDLISLEEAKEIVEKERKIISGPGTIYNRPWEKPGSGVKYFAFQIYIFQFCLPADLY